MDRQRRNLIVFGIALVSLVTIGLAQAPSAIRELGWISEAGRFEALSSEPAYDRKSVLAIASASSLASQYASLEELERDFLVGEFLFKTPLLLGGQAAKSGISCHSCHVNGRGNPHFQFPAISGEPGTADTTHNFFSETLGNGIPDPLPIPDLTQSGKVAHDFQSGELEQFIADIVVEEFAGRDGSGEFIRPLTTFVRALRLEQQMLDHQDTPRRARTALRDWQDAKLMVDHVMEQVLDRWEEKEPQSSTAAERLILSGARNRLALIHERLIPGTADAERAWLVSQSRALASIQAELRTQTVSSARLIAAYEEWEDGLASMPDLAALNDASLYDHDVLAASLRSTASRNASSARPRRPQ